METILDTGKNGSAINLAQILQLKTTINGVKTELKDMKADIFFSNRNPPQVPPSLRAELPAVLRESSLSVGQLIAMPE